MDACTTRPFAVRSQVRDVRKCALGFALAGEPGRGGRPAVVSTGKWGCGAFGGTAPHKMLQQLIGSRLAGARLQFSLFGRADGCDKCLHLLEQCQPPLTVAEAWHLVLQAGDMVEGNQRPAAAFLDYLTLLLRSRLTAECLSTAAAYPRGSAEPLDGAKAVEQIMCGADVPEARAKAMWESLQQMRASGSGSIHRDMLEAALVKGKKDSAVVAAK